MMKQAVMDNLTVVEASQTRENNRETSVLHLNTAIMARDATPRDAFCYPSIKKAFRMSKIRAFTAVFDCRRTLTTKSMSGIMQFSYETL